MIYHKFVLILKFKYILFTMQPRLQRSTRGNTSFTRLALKLSLLILLIFFGFFFIEKIDFPSPEKETIEDVTDKIIKLR